jgi:hypothetical protein
MLCTLYFRVLVTIMIDDMATAMHHLTEFKGLLCKGTGTVVVACDRMGDTENMKPKRRYQRGFQKGVLHSF